MGVIISQSELEINMTFHFNQLSLVLIFTGEN